MADNYEYLRFPRNLPQSRMQNWRTGTVMPDSKPEYFRDLDREKLMSFYGSGGMNRNMLAINPANEMNMNDLGDLKKRTINEPSSMPSRAPKQSGMNLSTAVPTPDKTGYTKPTPQNQNAFDRNNYAMASRQTGPAQTPTREIGNRPRSQPSFMQDVYGTDRRFNPKDYNTVEIIRGMNREVQYDDPTGRRLSRTVAFNTPSGENERMVYDSWSPAFNPSLKYSADQRHEMDKIGLENKGRTDVAGINLKGTKYAADRTAEYASAKAEDAYKKDILKRADSFIKDGNYEAIPSVLSTLDPESESDALLVRQIFSALPDDETRKSAYEKWLQLNKDWE